jgi:hypothetical protein
MGRVQTWTTWRSSTASRRRRYIDSGFGLLAGDVAFLTSILIAIDITLAGLFWALTGEDNVIAQLIRKVLCVGFFALLLSNFQGLADIVFQSFAGLGLKASSRMAAAFAAPVTTAFSQGAAQGYRDAVPRSGSGIEAIPVSPRLGDFNDDLRAFGLDDVQAIVWPQLAPEDVARFLLPAMDRRS